MFDIVEAEATIEMDEIIPDIPDIPDVPGVVDGKAMDAMDAMDAMAGRGGLGGEGNRRPSPHVDTSTEKRRNNAPNNVGNDIEDKVKTDAEFTV